jgi:hypothetical protein
METYNVSYRTASDQPIERTQVRISVPETIAMSDLDALIRAELPEGAQLVAFSMVLER